MVTWKPTTPFEFFHQIRYIAHAHILGAIELRCVEGTPSATFLGDQGTTEYCTYRFTH
jgi:hypothetical protein